MRKRLPFAPDEVSRKALNRWFENSSKFWKKVDIGGDDECWIWLGYTKSTGHGLTSYKSMSIHAHRKAWILTHGPIASNLCVNHRCDNGACCNPKHMYLGTRADNMIDRWAKLHPSKRGSFGRKHSLTEKQIDELWNMRRNGALLRECADRFGVCIQTIYRIITARRGLIVRKLQADRLSSRT